MTPEEAIKSLISQNSAEAKTYKFLCQDKKEAEVFRVRLYQVRQKLPRELQDQIHISRVWSQEQYKVLLGWIPDEAPENVPES